MFSVLSYQGVAQRYDFTVINVYRFHCLWIGFYEIDDTDYGFDDAMRGMMTLIYIYTWFLYDDIYEGCYLDFAGFTRVIRWCLRSYKAHMDGHRERSHMGLIYVVMCHRRRWCDWCFNHGEFGAEWECHGITPWLTQTNTSIELSIWYLINIWY